MIINLLKLLWMFFKIGLFTFGGGAAMIPLIKESVLAGNYDMTSDLIDQLIGLSQSTPGPIAVNMATYIGMSQFGLIGALFATFGVILPSFIIILIIAKLGSKAIESKWANYAFHTLKPAVIGLILSVGITMILSNLFPSIDLKSFVFDFKLSIESLVIFLGLISVIIYMKKVPPIKLILLSAILGIITYYIF